MAITKEVVEKRLRELEEAKLQYMANANACQGAIQDCLYWLGKIKEGAPEGASVSLQKQEEKVG